MAREAYPFELPFLIFGHQPRLAGRELDEILCVVLGAEEGDLIGLMMLDEARIDG